MYFSFDSILGDIRSIHVGDVVHYKIVEDATTGERNAIEVVVVKAQEKEKKAHQKNHQKKKRKVPPFIQARGPAEDGGKGFTPETWRLK